MSYYAGSLIIPSIDTANEVSQQDRVYLYQLLVNCYEDNSYWQNFCASYLKSKYPNNKEHIADLIVSFSPITDMVNKKAQVYTSKPERTLYRNGEPIDRDGEEYEIYQSILDMLNFDGKMLDAERRIELTRNVILNLHQGKDEGTFRIQMLNTPLIDVEQNDIDPSNFESCNRISIPVFGVNENSQQVKQWLVFKKEESGNIDARLCSDKGGESPIEPQPEGIENYSMMDGYPCILVQPQTPSEPDLFMDIRYSLLNFAIFEMISRTSTYYISMMKQPTPWVLSESSIEEKDINKWKSNPTTVVNIGDGELTQLTYDPQFEQWIDKNETVRIRQFSQSFGMGKKYGDIDDAPESGISKFYDNLPIREHRKESAFYFSRLEPNIYSKIIQMAIIVGFENAEKLEGTTMKVNFNDVDETMHETERVASIAAKKDSGLISDRMAIAEANMIDITDTDRIDEIIEEIRDTTQAAQPAQTTVLGAFRNNQ